MKQQPIQVLLGARKTNWQCCPWITNVQWDAHMLHWAQHPRWLGMIGHDANSKLTHIHITYTLTAAGRWMRKEGCFGACQRSKKQHGPKSESSMGWSVPHMHHFMTSPYYVVGLTCILVPNCNGSVVTFEFRVFITLWLDKWMDGWMDGYVYIHLTWGCL